MSGRLKSPPIQNTALGFLPKTSMNKVITDCSTGLAAVITTHPRGLKIYLMALSTPVKGQSRKSLEFTDDDIESLCKNLDDVLFVADKTSECCALLKQLYMALQAYINGSSCLPRVPPNITKGFMQILSESPQLKSPGVTHRYLLIQMIVSEIAFDVSADDLISLAASSAGGNANMASLYITEGQKENCLDRLIPHAKRWLLSQDFENQKTGLSFLTCPVLISGNLLDEETAAVVSEKIALWISSTGLAQAPNPRTLNPFRKDEETFVTEVDGTPSTNMFTVLSIGGPCDLDPISSNPGQYYTDEQWLNMHAFSCIYGWLNMVASRFGVARTQQSASETQGATPSISGATTYKKDGEDDLADYEKNRIRMDKAVASKVLGTLVGKSVDYCFRLIDQCELKTKVPVDAEMQVTCLVKAVRILDIICLMDEDQTARVFQEVKRVHSRISQESRFLSVHIHILTFYFHHSTAVVHDPSDSYQTFFTTLVPDNLHNQSFVFDVVQFVVKNLHELSDTTDVLTEYFPSLFKILAWHPRFFMDEFTKILPMAMDLDTSVEIFHLLLDLPCTTAALEVMEKAKKVEPSTQTIDAEPSNPVDAFHNARYKPLFIYITRSKSGQGDTIDRLSRLHAVLKECMSNTRVMVCCQLVPILLRIWFKTITLSNDPVFLAQLLPVLIERSSILVSIPELVIDVHKIFAHELVQVSKAFPSIVTIQQSDIKEFIQSTSNMAGRSQIYSEFIYIVGEFASPAHSTDCTSETIGNFYECLEVVAYELLNTLSSPEYDASIPRTLSCIVSALAKLASRCQDLIPRAILCLTKVVKQQSLIMLDPMTKDFIVNKASMNIALLKDPDTAYRILNPEPEIYTARWHQNNTSMSSILRTMERWLRKNMDE